LSFCRCDGSSHVRSDHCLKPALKPPIALAVPGAVPGAVLGAVPRADRQLVYIDSYSYHLPSFSSLFSLVSSISAIYRAPFIPSLNSILYVPSHKLTLILASLLIFF